MNIEFSQMMMYIATFLVNLVRTLARMGTGGAEVSEYLLTAERIKDNNIESWVQEWATTADQVAQAAEQALHSGQTVTARQAYLRASNYYRSAMFSLPHSDPRLDQYLTLSRACFHNAAELCTPAIEVVELPFGNARLPGYFLSAGKPNQPTLLILNGGDSTNEEMVHWLGFAAVARGWNCFVFEGPGQWSAMQLNPGLFMRHDYEVPVKAAVDYLITRNDVDPDKIALFGPSLGAVLAARVVAFEKRICACICSGLIVDVYEGWHAVWPAPLQKASDRTFDAVFTGAEKVSPQLHGLANHFRWMLGVSKPHEIINAWKPYNLSKLAPQIQCPLLLIYGEAEAAQSNEKVGLSLMRFLRELTCPVTLRMFTFEDGWAATHCQIGAVALLQGIVFDWLDKAVNAKETLVHQDVGEIFDVMSKYMRSREAKSEVQKVAQSLRAHAV